MAFSFKYPDTTAPTTTLEFSRGEFQGDVPYYTGNQETEESEYGETKTLSFSTSYRLIPLTVQIPIATQSGNLVDVTKFETFFKTVVDFASRAFYYTDGNGTSYCVKCITKDPLKPSRDYATYREFNLLLREVV